MLFFIPKLIYNILNRHGSSRVLYKIKAPFQIVWDVHNVNIKTIFFQDEPYR